MYIEPCCYDKQLTGLLKEVEGGRNVAHFFSNSDWDLTQLLPFFAARTPGGEVTLCLVDVEQNTLDAIRKLMKRTYINSDTKDSLPVVSHFTLITCGNNRREVLAHLQGVGDRLSICEDNIGFRCLACGNGSRSFVIQGSLNQRTLSATQMFTITTGEQLYNEAMEVLASKARVKAIKEWESVYQRITAND